MGRALLAGALAKGVLRPEQVSLCETDFKKAETLQKELHLGFTGSAVACVERSELILLAVKPSQVRDLLLEIQPSLTSAHVVVSVAAGQSLAALRAASGPRPALVRVMPNTPALVGEGASALCFDESVPPESRQQVRSLFEAVGTSVEVAEKDLDAVTGLSGSGPAYVFLLIEALADGGVRAGLSREIALRLAVQTVKGAASLASVTGTHPAELKDQVASPGGTTIAGIEALEAHGFRNAAIQAVLAAARRSAELSKT